MRKGWLLLAATLSTLVALSIGTPSAKAASWCANNLDPYGMYHTYAGYGRQPYSPGINGSFTGQVDISSASINNGGFVASWVGEQNSNRTAWIQAGLVKYGTAFYFYVEYNSASTGHHVIFSAATPSFNTFYTVHIYKGDPGTTWRATVDNGNYVMFNYVNLGFTGYREDWTTESGDTSGTVCNTFDTYFNDLPVSPSMLQNDTDNPPAHVALWGGENGFEGWVS